MKAIRIYLEKQGIPWHEAVKYIDFGEWRAVEKQVTSSDKNVYEEEFMNFIKYT